MRLSLTVAIVLSLAPSVAAQNVSATPAVATTTPTAGAASTPPPAKADEQAGYTYQGAGRRDPFVSLMRRGTDEKRTTGGVRAPGLAGLETAEVTLKGTMHGHDGYVAILLGADNKTYIVRPGDKLQDGAIRTIAQDSLVIVQQVNDPLSPQKQREVRKMLRQTEEVK